jgi:thimet oligopeptidase
MSAFINQTDTIIPFNTFVKGDLDKLADKTISKTQNNIEELVHNSDTPNSDNTIKALDEYLSEVIAVSSTISLLAYTHPNEELQQEAQRAAAKFGQFFNEIFLNKQLYTRFKALDQHFSESERAVYENKFIKDILQHFEKNGLNLPKKQQEQVRNLMNELSELGVQFTANIGAHDESMELTEEEMAGLPEDYKEQHKTEKGTYKIPLSYPSYFPFMKNAQNDDARKRLQALFKNIAADKNRALLDTILEKRQALAQLLGFTSFAEYQLTDRMAKTPKQVWEFENQLKADVKPKANNDYASLIEIKKALNPANKKVIESWQAAYYTNQLRKEKYQVDQEELKKYFPLNRVKEGLFHIAAQLYGIQFVPANNQPVWEESVEAWEIHENNEIKARFYLDLFPRKGKYNHAACFTLVPGRSTNQGYQKPSAALVCNFPTPTEQTPSLLLHNDVVTLFHEFGHLMHDLLTEAPLAMQAGTNVARDFVEMPSQIFENWAWEYESVSLFAKHHKTGKVLPEDLFNKVLEARNADSGLTTLQQIFYGTLDMTLHDKYEQIKEKPIHQVVKDLQEQITLYPFQEGTHFEAGFGHLVGYAAGYYGYLWAKVYAEDMFHELKKEGLMSAGAGKKLRNQVLAKGSSMEELDIVEQFLGRKPNSEAFMRTIGL